MTGTTLLLRQVHPSWVQAGRVTSQAFRPTPKDESRLSVYDGDLISPPDAFAHYTGIWGLASAGVLAVTVDECAAESLAVSADPLPDCPEHALIDFTGLTDRQCEKTGKKLRVCAEARGWMYHPPSLE